MDVVVRKSEICGEVQIPPSKSVAHRKMICASLAGGALEIFGGGKDIIATARCLEIMSPYIKNQKFTDESIPVLNAGESGSTLRFLLPVACALGAEFIFDGEGRLKSRPLGGLIDTLESRGAKIDKLSEFGLPVKVRGKLTAGEFKIDGSVSSQYITGLLFALPILDGDSRIVIKGERVSQNYVDITLGVLKEFGITIEKTDYGYFVKGNQKYVMSSDLSVESDWSSAGFMLALGVLAGRVGLKGLSENSLQGDKAVVDLLISAGADISLSNGTYTAKKSALHAIDFDAVNCPDAVPIMATVLSFAKGDSHIMHVDRLRDKESDRLNAIMQMLGEFGIETEYENDVLTVHGGEHKACEVDGFNDHRMAMSGIVCALATEGETAVRGVECISKSYPSFLSDIKSIGANAIER